MKCIRQIAIIALMWSGIAGCLLAQIVPPGSPAMNYTRHDSSGICDYLFISPFRFLVPTALKTTSMIVNRDAEVVWFYQHSSWALDFKVQQDGRLSYAQGYEWVVLDSQFAVVDTFRCVGEFTDPHDFILLPDGHAMMLCYEDSVMDLSMLLTTSGDPGDTAADVNAALVQELAPNHSIVREWRAFEHYSIFDPDPLFFTNPYRLEINHANSLDLHPDGRLLISNRANNDIACVDWNTGDLLWRLGGTQGDFTFTNDIGTSGQHDARFLPDGKISVFDNGMHHNPFVARALIYEIDTTAMTATKVWEYADSSIYTDGLGSFRVMPNGQRLINYGSITNSVPRDVICLNPDGGPAWEINIQNTYYTYRAQCMDLPYQLPRPELTCMMVAGQPLLSVQGSHGAYLWSDGSAGASLLVQDTGAYQVFVPHGIGMVGSEVLHISDLQLACTALAMEDEADPYRPDQAPDGLFDLLGRPISRPLRGQLLIERTRGQARKLVWE